MEISRLVSMLMFCSVVLMTSFLSASFALTEIGKNLSIIHC